MRRLTVLLGALVLLVAAVAIVGCGGDDEEGTGNGDGGMAIEASSASITVDGETDDWDGIDELNLTLEPIEGEEDAAEPKSASLKVAHDDEYVYVLLEVEDDYNWDPEDAHLSAASAVMWNVDTGGPHMGGEDPSGEPSVGMVDIWHWELECASGDETGGSVSDTGEGEDPGNDASCNFDDEWSTDPETREDDNGEGAENSLLGVWSHTNPEADGEGTWIFEARRPLDTGDEQDGQLAVGETGQLAVAYWDPDNMAHGWSDDEHVQSANQGWIEVTFSE